MQCSNCTSSISCHEHRERSLNAAPTLSTDQDQRQDDDTLTASSMSADDEERHRRHDAGLKSALRNNQDNGHPMVDHLNATDAQQRYQLEKEDNAALSPRKSPRILSFPHGDPENPYNWSTGRKIFVLFVGIVSVTNSTLGSSLPSGATEYLADYWNITSQAQLVLPISLFLVGYIFGPIVFAPLSETYGRRGILLVSYYERTLAVLDIRPMLNFPRLIIAAVSLVFLLFMPETYAPTILKRRAQKLRRETGDPDIFAPIELEKKGARQMITVTLTRPIRMLLFEAIVLFTCVYLSIAYAIFYLYFEAYPLVFQGLYRFNAGTAGLPFLAIGVGSFMATGVFMYWDSYLMRAKKTNAPWTRLEEYRRLPLACIGGPLFVVALFWLGWTAKSDIHWIVPTLSGIPFGIAFLLVFMALLNYITDAYEVFAASAMAATSACRSIFGAVLPLAARPMYNTLGIAWASSLLGFVSLGMCAIPFAFIKYGDRIRANSAFCQELRAKKEEYTKEREQSESLSSSQEGDVVGPVENLQRDGTKEEA
ncbi:MAG: hypothetical protein Q9203_006782 [Teloschistes exilis]